MLFDVQVIESINKCDVDIRRELFSSILVSYMPSFYIFWFFMHKFWILISLDSWLKLAGGTASMQQLKERLEKDLLEVYLLPAKLFFLKIKACRFRIYLQIFIFTTHSLLLCRNLLKLLELKCWPVETQLKEDTGKAQTQLNIINCVKISQIIDQTL